MNPPDPLALPPAERTGPHGERLCSATSVRSGEPCRAPAIKGGTVCVKHGGQAPQVKAKARARLLAAVDHVMARLLWLAEHSNDDRVRLQACRDLLDRAGMAAPTRVELDAQVTHAGTIAAELDSVLVRALEETRALADVHRARMEVVGDPVTAAANHRPRMTGETGPGTGEASEAGNGVDYHPALLPAGGGSSLIELENW